MLDGAFVRLKAAAMDDLRAKQRRVGLRVDECTTQGWVTIYGL